MIDLIIKPAGIGADQVDIIRASLVSAINEDPMGFYVNAWHLPQEICITINDEVKYLSLSWAPILNQFELVAKILVVIIDETEIRAIKEETHQQQLAVRMIQEIISVKQEKFLEFLATSEETLDKLCRC